MADTNLRSRVNDTVPDDVELFEQEGEVYGRDEHGEFKLDPMRGSATPQDGRCGAVCTYTMERYGETRYCTAMPESTFIDDGSDFCRIHKGREQARMERAQELYEHGYFAENYVNFAKRLDTTKFLFAVEMIGGLFEMSEHDFDITEEKRTLDATDANLVEEDSVEVTLPIPTNTRFSVQANELWTAALKEVMQQNMQEAVFSDGMSQATISESADMDGSITDVKREETEHHLHLPISRLANDIQDHLSNGGVDLDDDGSAVTFKQQSYTLDVEPQDDVETDADAGGDGAQEDFAEQLQNTEAEEVEIE